jgi:hypothetical protein
VVAQAGLILRGPYRTTGAVCDAANHPLSNAGLMAFPVTTSSAQAGNDRPEHGVS